MVDVRVRRSDGQKCRDRKVIEGTQTQARQWGERHQAVLLGELRAPPSADAPRCMTVGEFESEWLEKHCEASLHKQSGTDTCAGYGRHPAPFRS
jgi:hypothetical protein